MTVELLGIYRGSTEAGVPQSPDYAVADHGSGAIEHSRRARETPSEHINTLLYNLYKARKGTAYRTVLQQHIKQSAFDLVARLTDYTYVSSKCIPFQAADNIGFNRPPELCDIWSLINAHDALGGDETLRQSITHIVTEYSGNPAFHYIKSALCSPEAQNTHNPMLRAIVYGTVFSNQDEEEQHAGYGLAEYIKPEEHHSVTCALGGKALGQTDTAPLASPTHPYIPPLAA